MQPRGQAQGYFVIALQHSIRVHPCTFMRHSNLRPHALARPGHVGEAIAAGTVHGMNTFESGVMRVQGLAGLPRSNGKATLKRLKSHSSIWMILRVSNWSR